METSQVRTFHINVDGASMSIDEDKHLNGPDAHYNAARTYMRKCTVGGSCEVQDVTVLVISPTAAYRTPRNV